MKVKLMLIVVFVALSGICFAAEPPGDLVVEDAIMNCIKRANPKWQHGYFKILEKQIRNQYTREHNGETFFCYDFKCVYTWGITKDNLLDVTLKYGDVIEIVKRGKLWYSR